MPNPSTRRRFLAGAATLPAALAMPAAASAPADDSQILALFDQWLGAQRAMRLVTAQETEEGRSWAEAKIKALTGGDQITARFMRQDNFTFAPQFKLIIRRADRVPRSSHWKDIQHVALFIMLGLYTGGQSRGDSVSPLAPGGFLARLDRL